MQEKQDDVYLDQGMRGFIVNTAKREYWRVAGLCDLDDLIQDGYFCYAKCYARYIRPRPDLPGSEDNVRWFQALVKTTFARHIHDLATKRRGGREYPASALVAEGEDGTTDIFEKLLPPQPELGSFMTLLSEIPAELAQLVKVLASDGAQALGFERRRQGRRLIRETTNEYYCRILGVDPNERNLVEEIKSYFDGV